MSAAITPPRLSSVERSALRSGEQRHDDGMDALQFKCGSDLKYVGFKKPRKPREKT